MRVCRLHTLMLQGQLVQAGVRALSHAESGETAVADTTAHGWRRVCGGCGSLRTCANTEYNYNALKGGSVPSSLLCSGGTPPNAMKRNAERPTGRKQVLSLRVAAATQTRKTTPTMQPTAQRRRAAEDGALLQSRTGE